MSAPPPPLHAAEDAWGYLRHVGTQDDAAIDLAGAALALGLAFLPGVTVDRHRHHLQRLAEQTQAEFQSRRRAGEADDVFLRARALRKIIHEAHEYRGDHLTYNDVQNANFVRVIDRRRGLPVALGILYIAVARTLGWACEGLSFPAHFLLRLEQGGARLILDPFEDGREMDAAALRALLKSLVGRNAELSHGFYAAVSTRDILLRLQNNLKKRLIDGEDYAGAIVAAETIEAFSPGEYRTCLDRGVLHAKLGQRDAARAALEAYIARAPTAREKRDGEILLTEILG